MQSKSDYRKTMEVQENRRRGLGAAEALRGM
jgi:hypothetical protein